MKNRILLSLFAIGVITVKANATTKLDTITITASDRFATTINDTTANVTVITSDEIEKRGYVTLKDALSHNSSIACSSYGGNGQLTSIFMRGFGSGNVQILFNGVPLKDPTNPSFSSSIANLTLFNVDRIEVIKGAQSGIWGADAVAGVINIVTKKSAKEAYIGYGKYKTKEAGFAFGQDFGKVALSLNGNYYKTDGFSALSPRDAEADGYDHKDLNLNADFKINENNKLSVFYNYIDGKGDYDTYFPLNPNSTLEHYTFKNNLYGATYEYKSNTIKLKSTISKNKIKRKYIDSYPRENNGEVNRYTIDIQKSFNKHIVSAGLEYNKYKDKIGKQGFNNKAIWMGYWYTFENLLNAKTIFNTTIRYDKFDKFKNKLTYRIGVKRYCNAVEGLHSGFNVYSAYKAPSIFQFTNASKMLKPEYTKGYEISLGYKNLINVTYFYNKTEDKIGYTYNPTTYQVNYFNTKDTQVRKGIELSSRYDFDEIPLAIGFNYTHMFSIKDKNGNYYFRVPKNSANFFVDYSPTDNINIGADIQYVGSRYDIGNVKLKSYTLLNLHYNQNITKNLSLNVSATNILNKKYEEVKGYSTAGRAISAKLKYKF